MFETSKLPTEQRTVTGNSVSFNTHYALPLDACKVSFSATQSGSGTPTPSNNRPYIPINSIGLTANSTPVSVSLGVDYVGSELDLVNKELSYDKTMFTFTGSETWGFSNTFFYADFPNIPAYTEGSYITFSNGIKGYFYLTGSNQHRLRIYITGDNASYIDATTNMNDVMKSDVNGLTDIEKQTVSIANIPDLSSIIGNNTFSTDTGSLEISFQDLQEKSASGAVATFNTALTMPLVNGEFTIQAYQEGTGDPSPTNVRRFVPYNSMTITANGTPVTVNLGADTYGATYNSVSGKKEDAHNFVDLGDLSWAYGSGFGGYFYANIPDIKLNSWENCSCEEYKNHVITGNLNSLPNYNFGVDSSIKRVYFKNYDYTDANDFKNAVAGVKLVYELDTSIETQLTPTQIETIIGNNTIFADTGDTNITYKDCDIAKRGDFRQVFKIPD